MICPKCSADTKVVNSRPHKDDATVIQRRRWCDGCGHKFNTFESTVNVAERRKSGAAVKAAWRLANREKWLATDRVHNKRRYDRRLARAEAAKTGRRVEDIYVEWGCA